MSNRYQSVRIGSPVTARQWMDALDCLRLSLILNPPTATTTVIGPAYPDVLAGAKAAYNLTSQTDPPPPAVPMRLYKPVTSDDFDARVVVMFNPILCQSWVTGNLPTTLRNSNHSALFNHWDDNLYTAPIVYGPARSVSSTAWGLPMPSVLSLGSNVYYDNIAYEQFGLSIAGDNDWCTPTMTVFYDYSDFLWRGAGE